MSHAEPPGPDLLDAVIVGGGPAGLSAGLWLGRYRRRVHVYDAGQPRNRVAWAVHGFPGLPEISPAELRRRIRTQAVAAGAAIRHGRVVDISGDKDDFHIEIDGAPPAHSRRILLAYGLSDRVPDIPGLAPAYGTTVHHCPDCDGPSVAGTKVGVIGWDRHAVGLAVFLLTWTDRVVLFTHGRRLHPDDAIRRALARAALPVLTGRIARVDQRDGIIECVEFQDGTRERIDRIFFHIGSRPGSDLGDRLGCRSTEAGELVVHASHETTVPGVYAAGDIAGRPYLACSAAAEGVLAALTIHRSLLPAEYELD